MCREVQKLNNCNNHQMTIQTITKEVKTYKENKFDNSFNVKYA